MKQAVSKLKFLALGLPAAALLSACTGDPGADGAIKGAAIGGVGAAMLVTPATAAVGVTAASAMAGGILGSQKASVSRAKNHDILTVHPAGVVYAEKVGAVTAVPAEMVEVVEVTPVGVVPIGGTVHIHD